jgi:hypothetical protein
MSVLIAIDTGVAVCGVAFFHGRTLWDAQVMNTSNLMGMTGMGRVVVERPRVYGGRAKQGDTQDLLDVSYVAGMLVGTASERGATSARAVLPQEWKGSVPKQIMCRRAFARLDIDEKRVVFRALPPGEVDKLEQKIGELSKRTTDLLDAVGIGLWELGRMRKGRA